jgi:hypothetical protein
MKKTFRFGDWEYKNSVKSREIEILKYLGKDTDVTIPAQINGKKVYRLDSFVFSESPANINVKRVVFSEGLKRIDSHILSSSSIQEAVLPSTMQYIDYMGFGETIQRVIVDPNNPSFFDIDGVLFSGSEREANINLLLFPSGRSGTYRIPDGTIRVDWCAFNACKKLEQVIMPDSVVSLYHSAFKDCPKLVSVRLSPNIERLKENTFYNCPELADIKVSRKIKTIFPNAFHDCPKFNGINIQTRMSERER